MTGDRIRQTAVSAAAGVLVGAGLLTAPRIAEAQTPLPALSGRVVDTAEMLEPGEEEALTAFLAGIEAETSVQIVLVSVPALEEPIEDFTMRLAESWGIGRAETDNGVIVLVSRDDRRSRIEVGYGLEGVIPDGAAGRILRDELTPAFARGDYAAGFAATAAALARAAAPEFASRPPQSPVSEGRRRGRGFGLTLALLLAIGQILGWVGNAKGLPAAGAGGAVVGGLAGLLFFGALSLLFLIPLGIAGGLLATLFVRNSAGSHSGWGYGGVPGGGGMLWAPTRFGRSGGFGGGFSGFGGGFGGGGASGSW